MIPRLKGIYNCYQLSKFFRKLKIDLIHSFHYSSDYSEALAAKLAGIPWIYTKKNMNWEEVLKMDGEFDQFLLRTYFYKTKI